MLASWLAPDGTYGRGKLKSYSSSEAYHKEKAENESDDTSQDMNRDMNQDMDGGIISP